MNTGLIASRYARALLLRVGETGGDERVLAQVRKLHRLLDKMPSFRAAVEDAPELSSSEKLDLLRAATAPEPLSEELDTFFILLVRQGRLPLIRLVLDSFERQYCASRKCVRATLRTVTPSPRLEQALREAVSERTGLSLELETEQDPSLVGGFVLEMDDLLLDASVRHQLECVRQVFAEQNRRIV